MPKTNYCLLMEKEIEAIRQENRSPRLLLHVCCAPCSSGCLEELCETFRVTCFYFNPNISPKEEHDRRAAELERLIGVFPLKLPPDVAVGAYEPERFEQIAHGLEDLLEGGERCFACYRLRMEEAAVLAAKGGYDYFTTTLSISPLKNAEKINEIGLDLEQKYGVKHLPSDFKKKGGYQRSIVLSKEHGLYRQDYCGCVFSKAEREREKRIRSQMESD